jgi:hypothetical protein
MLGGALPPPRGAERTATILLTKRGTAAQFPGPIQCQQQRQAKHGPGFPLGAAACTPSSSRERRPTTTNNAKSSQQPSQQPSQVNNQAKSSQQPSQVKPSQQLSQVNSQVNNQAKPGQESSQTKPSQSPVLDNKDPVHRSILGPNQWGHE